MKIVDRDTFLAMPAGTVFCSYRREKDNTRFSPATLHIKEKSVFFDGGNDYRDYTLFPITDFEPLTVNYTTTGYIEAMTASDDMTMMVEGKDTEITPDYYQITRDGMFDDDWYMIYSPADVRSLIDRLERALSEAEAGQ